MNGDVALYYLAHGRAGDKGDLSNLSLIAYRPEYYELLAREITSERVAAWFADRRPQDVRRYLLPRLHAINFVLDAVLDGGVNGALNLDTHGKSLVFHLLDMPVRVPPEFLPTLPPR